MATRSKASTSKTTRRSQEHVKRTTNIDIGTDDVEMNTLLETLPDESQTLVKIITTIVTNKLKNEMDTLKSQLAIKDKKIEEMQEEITNLKEKIEDLEDNIDSVDQYERRDTIIISGPAVPEETTTENTTSLVTTLFKDQLKLNIRNEDINVAHRLGARTSQRKRPVIVKLQNRSLKYDLMGACIELKPQLYINESLTPARLHIFKQVLNIRKEHRDKFQQCYTKDGKITIKLKNSTTKHVIVNQKNLNQFLEKYPLMKETYLQATSPK